MQQRNGTNVNLKFEAGADAEYNADTNTITLNPDTLETEGGSKLIHEYFGHALASQMTTNQRIKFFEEISKTDAGEFIESQVNERYKDEIEADKTTLREEVISHYLEQMFDSNNSAKALAQARKVFANSSISERILNIFNRSLTKDLKNDKIIKAYAKSLNNFLNNSKRVDVLRVVAKIIDGKELTEQEQELANRFKNVIEVLTKGNDIETSVAYGKDLGITKQEYAEIRKNILSKYNNFLNNNPELTGGVFSSGKYLVLADNNNYDISLKKVVDISDYSRIEIEYLQSLFEKGEMYNVSDFNRLLRRGLEEIRKYKRGNKRNDIQSFEHKQQAKTNSINEDDGQRIDRSLKGLKSKDITQRFVETSTIF